MKTFFYYILFTYWERHMWRSEKNLQKLVLSFCPVHSREQAQAVRLGSKYLYSLGHPSSHREMKVLSFTVIPTFIFKVNLKTSPLIHECVYRIKNY